MANPWAYGIVSETIVNDASCLIDIRKGDLLTTFVKLPYQLVVPLPVRGEEILDFSDNQWRMMESAGLITHDLTPDEVGRALNLRNEHPALSANDCFCHISAESHAGILLTGDALLRKVASENGLEVHGILWVIDELLAARACATCVLKHALRAWQSDNSVFLPDAEIARRLARM